MMKKNIITFVILTSFLTTAFSQKESNVINLTKADFLSKVYNYEKNTEWKYEGSKPCIIDLYANWCKPCRMVAPIVEEIANEYKDRIIVYKIDTDKERELFRFVGIETIPTFIFIPLEGKPAVARGAMPKEEFEKYINQFLLK